MSTAALSRSVLGASWLAVRPARLGGPLTAALVLVVVTLPWQDSGYAVPVLHGVALLVGCAIAVCTDDPAAEVVAATPYPRHVRTLVRLGIGFAVAVPTFLGAAAVAELRFDATPMVPLAVEAGVVALVVAAIGSVLRARGMHLPAYPTVLALLLLMFALDQLPGGWSMVDPQPWGPPLEAALIRWAALGLLGVGVLAMALRDPANR